MILRQKWDTLKPKINPNDKCNEILKSKKTYENLKNQRFTFLEVSSALSDAFVSGIGNVGATDESPPSRRRSDAIVLAFY